MSEENKRGRKKKDDEEGKKAGMNDTEGTRSVQVMG
jgi:hypothetical protein